MPVVRASDLELVSRTMYFFEEQGEVDLENTTAVRLDNIAARVCPRRAGYDDALRSDHNQTPERGEEVCPEHGCRRRSSLESREVDLLLSSEVCECSVSALGTCRGHAALVWREKPREASIFAE
jgi:hypothetical protein